MGRGKEEGVTESQHQGWMGRGKEEGVTESQHQRMDGDRERCKGYKKMRKGKGEDTLTNP
jgi:hypothetical protein